jgi:hypothetical protein
MKRTIIITAMTMLRCIVAFFVGFGVFLILGERGVGLWRFLGVEGFGLEVCSGFWGVGFGG